MYQTLIVDEQTGMTQITLNRPEQKNSINEQMLVELNQAFDRAEANPETRLVIIQGRDGFFCTGMDFEEETQDHNTSQSEANSNHYMDTLKRLAATDKIVVSLVDGQAMAGGMGFVAASDLVYATPRAQFSLSEALWGLLPCCVTPFLIRRIGWQRAYRMTLTTLPLNAEAALACNLADEVHEDPQGHIRRLWLRLRRLDPQTIHDMKAYFREMWIVDDQMEAKAVAEIARLRAEPRIKQNIHNFVTQGKFPWD